MTTTYYGAAWTEITTSWTATDMFRRQMEIKNKTVTGFNIYSSDTKTYIILGF